MHEQSFFKWMGVYGHSFPTFYLLHFMPDRNFKWTVPKGPQSDGVRKEDYLRACANAKKTVNHMPITQWQIFSGVFVWF